MKTKQTTEQQNPLLEAGEMATMLESYGYKFLKMTDDHVYAISSYSCNYINDEDDLEYLLDSERILKSPWNRERRTIGQRIQKYIIANAEAVESNGIDWVHAPHDRSTLEWANFADKIYALIITYYEQEYN